MFLEKWRKRPSRRPVPAEPEATLPEPMDPSLYGRLVDGELPVGWLEFHAAFLQPRDAMLAELAAECENAPDEPSSAALRAQLAEAYTSYQEECRQRGECFVKYFQDVHGDKR